MGKPDREAVATTRNIVWLVVEGVVAIGALVLLWDKIDPSDEQNLWVLIVLGGLGVLVVGCTIVLLLLIRKAIQLEEAEEKLSASESRQPSSSGLYQGADARLSGYQQRLLATVLDDQTVGTFEYVRRGLPSGAERFTPEFVRTMDDLYALVTDARAVFVDPDADMALEVFRSAMSDVNAAMNLRLFTVYGEPNGEVEYVTAYKLAKIEGRADDPVAMAAMLENAEELDGALLSAAQAHTALVQVVIRKGYDPQVS